MKKTSFQNSTSRKYAPVAQEINNTDKVIVGLVSKSAQDGFTSKRILPEYGHLILQSSKVILLQAIYFICSHLCPTKCQLLYCDTDSIHLALAEKTLRYRRPVLLDIDLKTVYILGNVFHPIYSQSGIDNTQNILDNIICPDN